jgi:sugar/nucleoside kinase (ribokinase family)
MSHSAARTLTPPLDVVVVGLNVVDVLLRTPPVVERGAKHEIQDVVVQGGAPAGNAACLLAQLGWRTGFVARLGHDAVAQIARHDFRRCGVSDSLWIDDPAARPALAIVEIDPADGERTVFYTLAGYRWLAESDVCRETIAAARLVLVDGYEVVGARAALRHAEAAGLHRVVDLEAGDPHQLHELLGLATDAILPLAAAERLAAQSGPEATLETLAARTSAQLIVTDGVAGSWAWTPDGPHHQGAFSVQVVDTTGCGDAYHAAYASALLDGWPLALRMEFAAWVASRVALKLGGRSNLLTRDELAAEDLTSASPELQAAMHRGATVRAQGSS